MRRLITLLSLITVLVACSDSGEKPTSQPQPSATPTLHLWNYSGPSLGTSSQVGESSAESCSEGSSCSGIIENPVDLSAEPLPLTIQDVGDFAVGIPDGYNPLELHDQVLVSALSTETIGGYKFSLRKITPQELDRTLERFEQPDFAAGTLIQGDGWIGHWLPNEDFGAIALLETETGELIFVEAFATREYWYAFQSTFEEMLASISLTSE